MSRDVVRMTKPNNFKGKSIVDHENAQKLHREKIEAAREATEKAVVPLKNARRRNAR